MAVFTDSRLLLLVFLFLQLFSLFSGLDYSHRRDPMPIMYPGQVNIGIVANIHEAPPPNSTSSCGPLRPDAVQKVMSSVWAAHQANFKKDDPHDLNIGVYIYDTCGREDVAQRQVYRLLGHVGHVQTTTCSEKRIPPLFAVITEGDQQTLRTPLHLLEAFGVPVISTSGGLTKTEGNGSDLTDIYLSTAPTASALSRAAVTVLRQLRLLEVAVIAEDQPPSAIFGEFAREAHISGMQALPVDHPSIVGDPDNFLASLQVVSAYGKSKLKAVVFLISEEQAIDLLSSVDSSNYPQMPWVVVTPTDISPTILATFKRHHLRRLQQVLLLSAETSEIPEFQDYFKQLLQEDTIKYHPLLTEFAEVVTGEPRNERTLEDLLRESQDMVNEASRLVERSSASPDMEKGEPIKDVVSSYEGTDVTAMVKAVWTLAASLRTVQRRSCRRGTDCLLYLRRSLSSYVLKAAKALNYTLDESSGAASLQGTTIRYREDGVLTSVRFSLKGFTYRGDMQEVGWYSDETGLVVDYDVILPFNGFVFKNIDPHPSTSDSSTSSTSVPEIIPNYKLRSQIPTLSTTRTSATNTPPGGATTTMAHDYHATNMVSATPGFDGDSSNGSHPTGPESTSEPFRSGNQTVAPTDATAETDFTSWRIFDDLGEARSFFTTQDVSVSAGEKSSAYSTSPDYETSSPSSASPSEEGTTKDIFEEPNLVLPKKNFNLSYGPKHKDLETEILLGPPYSKGSMSSSNLRSVSLTSHNEPMINDALRQPKTNEEHTVFSFGSNGPAMARSIDRTSAGVAPPVASEDVHVISAAKNLRIAAWLARPWALSVLGVCGFGILVTMYVLVFLMVKSCEGSLKKTNTLVAVAQLLSLMSLYVSAGLFTWKPSALLCGLQRLLPNISYAFCFGCLLLKGMHLRAQNSLGLGGSVNRFNQILTLLFVVGVQAALEIQWWFVRPPAVMFSTMECITTKQEIMESQGYVSFLLLLSVVLAVSTRKIPYNCQEVRSLIGTSLTCLIVFLAWDAACWLLPDSNSRNIAAPSALIVTAVVVLIGIFGPQLFAIHKYGGFPHKPLSYADSLSTVFTMFKDLDNGSSSGTTGRGKKTAKTLETPFGNEVNEGTRNPLYNDFQSAYP